MRGGARAHAGQPAAEPWQRRGSARHSGPAVAGRWRRRGTPRPGGPGDPGARGGAPRARAGAPRGMRRWWHAAGTAARQRSDAGGVRNRGKRAREEERDAGKLTAYTNQAEEGRKGEVDVRGRSSGEAPMVAGGGEADSAGKQFKQVWGGATEVEDEVEQLWALGMLRPRSTRARRGRKERKNARVS